MVILKVIWVMVVAIGFFTAGIMWERRRVYGKKAN